MTSHCPIRRHKVIFSLTCQDCGYTEIGHTAKIPGACEKFNPRPEEKVLIVEKPKEILKDGAGI